MKQYLAIIALALILAISLVACDQSTEQPEQSSQEQTTESVTTTEQPTTEQPTTEQPTTEEPTTEEITSEEVTTQEKVENVHPSLEEVKAAATVVLEVEDIMAAANNKDQDWSDFGGLTQNEDGSLTALFRYGTDNIWDPYFYLIRQDTTVDNILVIQYRSELDQMLNLYMGTEGNTATGRGDHVGGDIYATDGDWAYLVMDLTEVASAYDEQAAALGYLRFGLTMAESGDSVDFGFVAFFHTMDQVSMLIP